MTDAAEQDAVDFQALLRGRRALIFDFDGTIADTSPLHARAFEEVLAPIGVPVDYPALAGLKTLDALQKCLRDARVEPASVDILELVAQKQRRARELIDSELTPLPRVDAFLKCVRCRFQLALVTSGSRKTIELALQKLGYAGWFDPVVCADDVTNAKPAPDGFQLALRAMRCAPREALVFEDSEPGFRAARAADLGYIDVRHFDWRLFEEPGEA
jgi:HAD superfamily hydrolase (TIGR01509 family)